MSLLLLKLVMGVKFCCFERWIDPEMGPRAMPDCNQPLQGLVRVETAHYVIFLAALVFLIIIVLFTIINCTVRSSSVIMNDLLTKINMSIHHSINMST